MKVIPIGNRLGVTCEEMIQSSAQKVTVADSYIPAAQPTGEILVQTSFDMNPVYEYVYDPKYFAPYNGMVRDHIGYLHPKLEELIPETMDEYDAVIKTFREMPIPITYGNKNHLGVEYPTHRVTSGTCYACSLSGFIPQVVDASGQVIKDLKKSKFDPSSMRYELKKDLTESIGRVGCVDASQDYIGPQADVMIIGQYPTMNAIRAGKPFESDHKFYIDNFLLPAAGIERSKVVYSYACHCRQGAKDNVKPKKENVEACYMNRLRAEILHYQPKLIIAMGPEPQIVFKGFAKVDTYRGTGEEWVEESTGFKTIVCYTHSVNIIDADNAPKQNKSQSGDTDTKRDARDLMMSDFAWIGDVYRDPSWLHPLKKVAIQTDYKVLMPDDHIDKYVAAFESLRAMIYAKPDRLVAVDIETTAVTNDITCMSFTPVPGKAFVFPMLSRVFPNEEKPKFAEASLKKDASGKVISDSRYIKNGALSKRGEKYAAMPDFIGEDYFVKDDTKRQYIYDMIKYLLEEPTIHKVAHNGRFDARIIYMNGIDMRSFRHDTLIAHCLINEESVRGLKDLTDMYIRRLRGYSVAMEEAKEKYVTDGNWLRIPYVITAPYNAIDTDATLSLFYYIKGRVLQTDPNDWAFYEYYGMKLQDVMLRMEHVGALVDDKYIKEQNEKTYVQLKEVAKRIIDFLKEKSTKFNTLSYDNINEEGCMDKATTQCPKGFKADGNTDVTDVLVECGVELTARTDTGWARGEDVLAVFSKHEVVGKFITDVLEHRSLATRLAFYKDYMDKRDAAGRVHSSFAVWGAATGRFTCSKPNLQNLPRDKAIKMLIVAPDGYSIVQGDLSQAELRILAYYSGEERMQAVFRGFTARCDNVQGMILNMSEKTLGDTAFFYLIENKRNKNWYCFKPVAGTETSIELIGKVVKDEKLPGAKKIVTETPKGQYIVPITHEQLQAEFCHGDFLSTGSGDIHCFTASQINDCLLSEVVKSQRSAAKSVSFGIPYGISAHGLAAQLETTKEEAQKLMDLFFTKFPKVRDYLNGVVKTAGEYASRHGIGVVTTEFGRKRRLSDFTSWMKERRGHAERQAVNFGIQSTCHDLMARHIITIDEEIGQTGLDAKMFNQVHDSVLFYVKTEQAQAFAKWLKQIMERPYLNTDMPFTADVEIYRREWSGEMIDIEEEAMAA